MRSEYLFPNGDLFNCYCCNLKLYICVVHPYAVGVSISLCLPYTNICPFSKTHQKQRQSADHCVKYYRRNSAGRLGSMVRLGVGIVIAEKPLDVHVESVGVLKVVSQHDSPCHDHQLEVKHDHRGEANRAPRKRRALEKPG